MRTFMTPSRFNFAALLLAALAPAAHAAINASTGSYVVAQGSSLTTTVTVADSGAPADADIEGMVFTYQIDGGTGSVPSISSIDLLTNTVWTGHVSPGNVLVPAGGNLPQYQSRDLFTDAPGDFINANGTLARVTISAATAPLGTYNLKLTGTRTAGRDSTFLDGMGWTVPATFTGGTLTVAAAGDATLDGKVDAFDLNALAANWQYGTAGVVGETLESALAALSIPQIPHPSTHIPEPATLSLLALAPFLRRRPRRTFP
jgi:hypothetical protein